jgi:hypothetical protein
VLAVPESGNHEQSINAHFVRQLNAGDWVSPRAFTVRNLHRFLDHLPGYRSTVPPERVNGLPVALEVIRQHLPVPLRVTAEPQPILA